MAARKGKDVAPKLPGKQTKNPPGQGQNPPGKGINNPPGSGPDNPPGTCPQGFVWDVKERRCVPRTGTKPDVIEDKNCPKGYRWDRDKKRCVKVTADAGQCPDGYRWSRQENRCVKIDPGCPDGFTWDESKKRCVQEDRHGCPPGYYWDQASAKCLDYNAQPPGCPEGQKWDNGRKTCVPISNEAHDCPDGHHWDATYKKCVQDTEFNCPDGYQWDTATSTCIPISGETACPEGFTWNASLKVCVQAPEESEDLDAPADDPYELAGGKQSVLATLRQFLIDNELPESLISFIQSAMAEAKPFSQIIAELRATPEYEAAYPENKMRRENGFDWQPEAWIREYRSQARRIAKEVSGLDLSNSDIAQFIATNRSLSEFNDTMKDWEAFQRWGPTVRGVFEEELGYRIPDDRLFAFISNQIPTPELDRAYESALYRGRPALLGLGVRPEDEEEMLRKYGIDVEAAFRGYQGIVAEMPRAERFALLENQIGNTQGLPADGSALFNSTPFATLFRAIQLGDQDALRQLQDQMLREVARQRQEGSVAFSGKTAVGIAAPGTQ